MHTGAKHASTLLYTADTVHYIINGKREKMHENNGEVKAIAGVFAIIGGIVLLLGVAALVAVARGPAVSHWGTVVESATPLGYRQMAVNVDGQVNSYPMPDGVGAVREGERVTVWTQGGSPVESGIGNETPSNPLVGWGAVVFGVVLIGGAATVACREQLREDAAAARRCRR